MDLKDEVLNRLEYLIQSAKKQKVEQGVLIFSTFRDSLKDTDEYDSVLKRLYHHLCGMQRYANFSKDEWEIFDELITLLS